MIAVYVLVPLVVVVVVVVVVLRYRHANREKRTIQQSGSYRSCEKSHEDL